MFFRPKVLLLFPTLTSYCVAKLWVLWSSTGNQEPAALRHVPQVWLCPEVRPVCVPQVWLGPEVRPGWVPQIWLGPESRLESEVKLRCAHPTKYVCLV